MSTGSTALQSFKAYSIMKRTLLETLPLKSSPCVIITTISMLSAYRVVRSYFYCWFYIIIAWFYSHMPQHHGHITHGAAFTCYVYILGHGFWERPSCFETIMEYYGEYPLLLLTFTKRVACKAVVIVSVGGPSNLKRQLNSTNLNR